MTWKHVVMGVLGFGLGFWLCMPRETALAPRWEVLVQDTAGHGLGGAEVTQTRSSDVAPSLSGYTIQTADGWGRAAFPAVHTRTSPLLRVIACVRVVIAHGPHSRCGYHQDIRADVPGYAESARREGNLTLKERGRLLTITVRPVQK